MGKLSVYEPAAGRNYCKNPSFGVDTGGGWVANASATIARTLLASTRGPYALSVTGNIATSGSGAKYTSDVITPTVTALSYITVSLDVHLVTVGGGAQARCQVVLNYTVGTKESTETVYSTAGVWNHYSITMQVESGKTLSTVEVRVYATDYSINNFYVDGVQIEASSVETSYIDGSRAGCAWTGTAHASESTRNGQYRGGGVLRDIESYCGVRMVALLGIGATTHELLERPYSTMPGSIVDGYRLADRELTVVLMYRAANLAGRHVIRKALNALFLPSRVYPSEQPLRLRYTGASATVEFDAYYAEGLEGDFEGKAGNIERIALVLRCPDPFLTEMIAQQRTSTVGNAYSVSMGSFIRNTGGTWANVSASVGTSAKINAIYPVSDGWIIAGSFTDLGGVGAADNIAKVSTAGAVTALGTGCAGEVYGIRAHASGKLIVWGAFTSAGGVSNTAGIAFVTTAGTWTAVAGGVGDGVVYDVDSWSGTGNIYICGTFTHCHQHDAADVSNTNKVARLTWSDPNHWVSISGAFTGTDVRAIRITSDAQYIWYGGTFTALATLTGIVNLARFHPATGVWTNPGSCNSGGIVNTIEALPSGAMAVAGTGITSVGGVVCVNVARKTSTWAPLWPGLNATVRKLRYLDSKLYACGDFTDGGSYALGGLYYIAYYDDSWHNFDAGISASGKADDIVLSGGVYYLALNGAITVWSSGPNVTVNNPGTTRAYPRFYFPWVVGSSVAPVVRSITNVTTNQTILLNHAVGENEVFVVDLNYKPDPILGVSSAKKRIYGYNIIDCVEYERIADLESGSDLSDFCLVPGGNTLRFFVAENISAANASTVIVAFDKLHDSGDI